MTRDFRFDHLKFLLIYLVVVGHFLIIGSSGIAKGILATIYIFHMPIFVFVTGYFSRSLEKYSKKIINRAISFFILYFLFIIIQQGMKVIFGYGNFNPDFINRHGASWYLFVSALYTLITPILLKSPKVFLWLLCFCASLISVYKGKELSLFCIDKTLAFLPMYILGLKIDIRSMLNLINKRIKFYTILVIFILFIMLYAIIGEKIHFSNVYYDWNYLDLNQSLSFTLFVRICFLLESVSIMLLMMSFVGNKKSIISEIGTHTLSIYIFHVLFRDIFEHVLGYSMTDTLPKLIFILCLSMIIVYIFSRKPFIYIEKIMKIKWIR